MDEEILFTCEVNSFYGNKHSLAHLYITKEEIIMTRQSLWNMKVGTHGKTTLFGLLDGEGNLWFRNRVDKLLSISRTKAGLNGKACLFKFTDDEIKIILDFPKKTLPKIMAVLPPTVVNDYQ